MESYSTGFEVYDPAKYEGVPVEVSWRWNKYC